ncbi:ATPase [Candidatus Collierbacteria bacterium CG1_02_44_10]|uniref:ATPase n=1 Tax=Candidatus Collierbacteria bacterium CG1_02_44_10 TaxID=1805087 RepID=A0A1J4RTI9_9BACT|nr:ATP-binding protein [bacterium]OIN90675.1 MAG: ATPase [Candidatus Collierbacteria bacterium CG1_02_44_10]
MVYKRKIYQDLLAHAQTPMVTVLTGMRRTGKTTLVSQLLKDISNKNSIFLDLQRPDSRELFEQKNYDNIYEALVARGMSQDGSMVVALDEIQLAPDCPSAIKYLYDHKGVKFIVTGSSSYYLKNLFSESLAGRKKIFELFPLDFGEFLLFRGVRSVPANWQIGMFDKDEYNRLSAYYEEFIRFGGFPQVVLAGSEVTKKDILLDIMSSYVNIDIRSLADFSDERNLFSLAKLLATRAGNRIEYNSLAKQIGLSRQTVKNYITFFEKTYLIHTVPVYTKNAGREIVKARKLYFCDTGLANTLAELSSGAQFENTIYNQIVKLGTVQYYALKTGREIDFVLDGRLALEVKETPTDGDLSVLRRLSETAGIKETILVSRNESPLFENYIWGGSIQ